MTPKIVFVANSLRVGGSQSVLLELVDTAISGGFDVVVASKGGPLQPEFERRGARCHTLVMREGVAEAPLSMLNPGKAAKAALSVASATRLARIAGNDGPVLFHASHPWPVGVAAIAAKRLGAPLLWHVHGTSAVEMPPQFPRRVRGVLGAAVAITPEVAGPLSEWLCDSAALVLPNPTLVSDPSYVPASDGRLHIGTVCTLTANKREGVSATMVAAERMARRQRVCLHVVGDGPEREHLENEALDVAEPSRLDVVFHGQHDDPWGILSRCRVIVGVGLVVLEAAMRGHRVVVAGSDAVGGVLTESDMDSLWRTNYTGRGIGLLDAETLASAMAKAVETSDETVLRTREVVIDKHGSRAREAFVTLWDDLVLGTGQ